MLYGHAIGIECSGNQLPVREEDDSHAHAAIDAERNENNYEDDQCRACLLKVQQMRVYGVLQHQRTIRHLTVNVIGR